MSPSLAADPSERSRRNGFGPGEWILLVLPILAGARLRTASGGNGDVIAADLLVDMAGPGLALLAFAVGAGARIALPRECRGDTALLRRASTWRMLAIVAAATIGLRLVFPFEFLDISGPWRRMAWWCLGVAIPSWAAGLFALVRGRHTAVAGLAAALAAVTAPLVATGLGMAYELPLGALVVPGAVCGLVLGGGIAFASWFGVAARGAVVLPFLSALSVLPAWAVAYQHATVPIESLEAGQIIDWDSSRRRALLQVYRLDTVTHRIAEVNLETGKSELLPPRHLVATFAGGTRVTVRRTRWAYATSRGQPRALCRTLPGDPELHCLDGVLPADGGVILTPHPSRPLVLATTFDRILVWNLETGELHTRIEQDSRIRWPCFADEETVLYRIQRAVGPFSQYTLPLDSLEPQLLPDGHDVQCTPNVQASPAARFIRGTKRLSKPSRILAAGLPPEGVVVLGPVIVAAWSGDGETLALLFQQRMNNLGAYNPKWGFMPRATIPPTSDIHVSRNGEMLAFAVESPGGEWRVEVVNLPEGDHVSRFASDSNILFWDDSGLLVVDRRQLLRIEPRTSDRAVLFPPATEP